MIPRVHTLQANEVAQLHGDTSQTMKTDTHASHPSHWRKSTTSTTWLRSSKGLNFQVKYCLLYRTLYCSSM